MVDLGHRAAKSSQSSSFICLTLIFAASKITGWEKSPDTTSFQPTTIGCFQAETGLPLPGKLEFLFRLLDTH